MTGIWKLIKTPGITNAHARLMNWVVLAMIAVELVWLLFGGDLSSALSNVASTTSFYVLLLLVGPAVFRWFDPGFPVEREGAWRVGVAVYGGVSLAIIVWSLLPLFDWVSSLLTAP